MTREEEINFITLTLNKICEAELGQVNASKWDGKAIKTTDTKVIATELYEKGLQIVESDDVVISKYEYNFLKNNQKDGRPDGATNLLIKMNTQDLLKEFVEWYKKVLEKDYDDKSKMQQKELEIEDNIHFYYGQCTAISRLITLLDSDLEKFMEKRKDVEPKKSTKGTG